MSSSPFLVSIREHMLVRRYSLRTIKAYLYWIKYFIVFNGKRHPSELEFRGQFTQLPNSGDSLPNSRLRIGLLFRRSLTPQFALTSSRPILNPSSRRLAGYLDRRTLAQSGLLAWKLGWLLVVIKPRPGCGEAGTGHNWPVWRARTRRCLRRPVPAPAPFPGSRRRCH